MKKQELQDLFEANSGKNFVLATDVAVGHGLNGVSYTSFSGRCEWDDSYVRTSEKRYEYTKILSFEESYLLIRVDRYDESYNSGIFTYAIPYEHIISVMFVEETRWFNRLTKHL